MGIYAGYDHGVMDLVLRFGAGGENDRKPGSGRRAPTRNQPGICADRLGDGDVHVVYRVSRQLVGVRCFRDVLACRCSC
ncbi:hypothetical protein D3C76_1712230 [compost metagenome]